MVLAAHTGTKPRPGRALKRIVSLTLAALLTIAGALFASQTVAHAADSSVGGLTYQYDDSPIGERTATLTGADPGNEPPGWPDLMIPMTVELPLSGGGTDHFIVTAIAESAFKNSAVRTVVVADTVLEIGRYAFEATPSLTAVDLGGGVQTIGAYAFYASSLPAIEVPSSVTRIDGFAFSNTALTSLVINGSPAGTVVSEQIIENTSSLQSITVNGGNGAPTILSTWAFASFLPLAALTSITTTGNVVIEPFAFAGLHADNLHSVVLGEGLLSIGNSAFESTPFSNSSPQTLHIESGTIGPSAFLNGERLTNVTLGDNVTVIGLNAFENNTGLTSVVIGDGVTVVGADAFAGTSSLRDLRLGKEVARISHRAFLGSALTSVTLPRTIFEIGMQAFDSSELTDIYMLGNAPSVFAGTTTDGTFGLWDLPNVKRVHASSTATGFGPGPLWRGYELVLGAWLSYELGGVGGTISPSFVPIGSLPSPPTPTAPGETFGGWYVDASLTTPFDSSTPLSGDLTLFAAWAVAPDAPTGLVATLGAGMVDLAWVAPAHDGHAPILDYLVEYRAVGESVWQSVTTGGAATTLELTGLAAGLEYEFRVSAINLIGASVATAPVAATTLPMAPAGLAVIVGFGQLFASWQPAVGAEHYELRVMRGAQQLGGCVGAGTSCLVTGLSPGAVTVEVVAVNSGGSVAATPQTATVLAATDAPIAPPADRGMLSIELRDHSGRLVTEARQGETLTLTVHGLMAASGVEAFMYSTPQHLNRSVADAAGATSFVITVPSALPLGEHTIVAMGLNGAGEIASARIEIRVVAANDDVLEVTGGAAPNAALGLGALGLLLGGGVLAANRLLNRRTS